MNIKSIRQFKLTSGEDILAEVIEWPDEENSEILCRNVYKVHTTEKELSFYYTLKPWMTFQSDPEMFLTLNINHIIGEATPALIVVDNYKKIVKAQKETLTPDISQTGVEDYNDAYEKLEDLWKKLAEDLEAGVNQDSGDNVVSLFRDKDKLH